MMMIHSMALLKLSSYPCTQPVLDAAELPMETSPRGSMPGGTPHELRLAIVVVAATVLELAHFGRSGKGKL